MLRWVSQVSRWTVARLEKVCFDTGVARAYNGGVHVEPQGKCFTHGNSICYCTKRGLSQRETDHETGGAFVGMGRNFRRLSAVRGQVLRTLRLMKAQGSVGVNVWISRLGHGRAWAIITARSVLLIMKCVQAHAAKVEERIVWKTPCDGTSGILLISLFSFSFVFLKLWETFRRS